MNKNNAAAYLPLVQALSEGKTLQHIEYGNWCDLVEMNLAMSPELYRIKPEEDKKSFDEIMRDIFRQDKTPPRTIQEGLKEVSKAIMDEVDVRIAKSLPKNKINQSAWIEELLPKPKDKKWYRVGWISGEVLACSTEQGEKSAEKYVGHRWLTDRIEYEVEA